MQDVKGSSGTGTSVCASSSIPVGTEGRLIDRRDNKIYWVAKLNDGLCWMTQNLDYTGYGTATTNFASGTGNTAQYYDPGDYVYTLGSGANGCSPTTSTGLSGCTDKGWKLKKELVDSTWTVIDDEGFYSATSYTSADGKMICTKQTNSWLGDMTSDYIPCRMYSYWYILNYEHYVAGKYYNWMAATNGTSTSSVTSDGTTASGSICPTGWSLPLSGNASGSNNNIDGSFYKLVNGLTNAQITVAPYYFVYGGYVNTSTLTSAGSSGYYWSATAYSASNAYNLTFSSSSVNPSNRYNRYNGSSVRCVAR